MSLVSVFSYYRVSKSLMVFFELLRYIIKNIINHLSPPKKSSRLLFSSKYSLFINLLLRLFHLFIILSVHLSLYWLFSSLKRRA